MRGYNSDRNQGRTDKAEKKRGCTHDQAPIKDSGKMGYAMSYMIVIKLALA
jgi:hypothetical protein